MWLMLWACGGGPAEDPGLSVAQIATKVRADADDRSGWAEDVREGLVRAGVVPDENHVCQVLAVIEQESGYQPDPAVPGLSSIARRAIEDRLSVFGPAAEFAEEKWTDWLLSPVPEGETQSFAQRLSALETERDLDRLYRDLLAYHTRKVPKAITTAAEFVAAEPLERMNPVQTAGSMQVSVLWAQDLGRKDGLDREAVRELLYTRAGGVRFGAARLFAHEAPYEEPKYRFADYNAGLYAARNAAFQTQLAAVTGLTVKPDGDLLLYTDGGRPKGEQNGQTMAALRAWRTQFAPDLTDADLIRDARREKEPSFEDTDLWTRVRATYRSKLGKTPAYARMPDLALDSPKITKPRTTAWFAESVDRRYRECLQR